jgi:hypothetical protein
MTSRLSNNLETTDNLTNRERDLIHTFVINGHSMSFARQMTGLIMNRDMDNINASVIKTLVSNQVEYQKKRINPQDVEVVIDIDEEVKTRLVNYFNFVDLKFKSPDAIRHKHRSRLNENRDGSSPNGSEVNSPFQYGMSRFKENTNLFDSCVDHSRSKKSYASTPHTQASAARVVAEHILVRDIPRSEKFIGIGIGYEQMMKRGLNCHICFPVYQTKTLEFRQYTSGPVIPGAVTRINKAEFALRKYVNSVLRDRASNHTVFKDFNYGTQKDSSFYENTGLQHRCFQSPEMCEEKAGYGVTMFSGSEYSVERLCNIMHLRGIHTLHGLEPASVTMLRNSTGKLPLFDQDFKIDLEQDVMLINNNDLTLAYRYKYSEFRQFFFEHDVVVEDTVYSFTHQVINDSFLKYTIVRKPKGVEPMVANPVVDIHDDQVFLRTYDFPKNWNRQSKQVLVPVMISCHVVIYAQILEHLVRLDKCEEDILVTAARYLRSLNSEFVINGATFQNFSKLSEDQLSAVAVALLVEAVRTKIINNTIVSHTLGNFRELYKKRSILNISFDYIKYNIKAFREYSSFDEIANYLEAMIVGRIKNDNWTQQNVIEFMSYSHLVDNPYSNDCSDTFDVSKMTPFERLWFSYLRDESDNSYNEWWNSLKTVSAEPTYSILGSFIESVDLDTYVQDLMNDEEDELDVDASMNNILDEEVQTPIDEVDVSGNIESSESESDVMDRLFNDLLISNASVIDQNLTIIRPGASSDNNNTNNNGNINRTSRNETRLRSNDVNNFVDVVASEIPIELMVSDISLPFAENNIVTNARKFTTLMKEFTSLRHVNLHEVLGLIPNTMTDFDKCIFEAYEYRKHFSACTHNTMQMSAVSAFVRGEEICSGFFDSPQNVKSGYNIIYFENGLEVRRKFENNKAYIIGYLPMTRVVERTYHILKLVSGEDGKLHNIISSGNNLYTGMLLVSDLTIIMNDENIAKCLGEFERNYVWPESITLVNAMAGSGKTYSMKEEFEPNNFYIGSTRNVVQDLRDALKFKNESIYPDFDFVGRIRTIDSVTVNGVRNGVIVENLCFDECFQSHPGEILRIIQMIKPKKVKLYGDALQIRFIDRLNIKTMLWKSKLERFVTDVTVKNITRRCPIDATIVLNDKFYSVDPLFNTEIYTTSEVTQSMQLKKMNGVYDVPYYSDVLYLTWTKNDAHSLNEAWKNYSLENKKEFGAPTILTADGLKVRTVHTGQGMDVKHVIIVKNSPHLEPTAMSKQHMLALSRHKVSLTYYTKNVDDPFAKLIKYANTRHNYVERQWRE